MIPDFRTFPFRLDYLNQRFEELLKNQNERNADPLISINQPRSLGHGGLCESLISVVVVALKLPYRAICKIGVKISELDGMAAGGSCLAILLAPPPLGCAPKRSTARAQQLGPVNYCFPPGVFLMGGST